METKNTFENAIINNDIETKQFLKREIFGNSTDVTIEVSVDVVLSILEDWESRLAWRDKNRTIFVINGRKQGLSYAKIAKLIGLSDTRVYEIYTTFLKIMKHPKNKATILRDAK